MTTLAQTKTSQVKTVLWRILFLNLLVSALKIGVGVLSGTVSIIADGFHSLMDGSSNIVGLIALRIAQVPPDEEHPYGHRKAETLATLFIGILLLFAAYEILKSSFSRLMEGTGPDVTPVSFGVMVFTIGMDTYGQGDATLSDCASGPSNFYDVSSDNLALAFASIARSINQLRLTN